MTTTPDLPGRRRPFVEVGCGEHVHFIVIEDRYIRWRCKHRQCSAAVEGKRLGMRCFHVHDLATGDQWDEFETPAVE